MVVHDGGGRSYAAQMIRSGRPNRQHRGRGEVFGMARMSILLVGRVGRVQGCTSRARGCAVKDHRRTSRAHRRARHGQRCMLDATGRARRGVTRGVVGAA